MAGLTQFTQHESNPLLFTGIFISFFLGSCFYSGKTARKLLSAARQQPVDIVVVPGVPFENGKWSRTMKARVYWAKYLFDNGITKNILFSGSAVYSPYYEGMIMATYATALGIPAKNVYWETKAEHSTENIYYSYQKARELGFEKIALASDPFQVKFLKSFTGKKVSPAVTMLPMVMDTMKVVSSSMTDPVIDASKAYHPGFIALNKRENVFKRLKGTLGYNLKDSSKR